MSDNTFELQKGIIRTNCWDSLDRTNFVQQKIAEIVTQEIINQISKQNLDSRFYSLFKKTIHPFLSKLWVESGSLLSFQLTGAEALTTDLIETGRKTIFGQLAAAGSSIKRTFRDKLNLDYNKQVAFEIIQNQFYSKLFKNEETKFKNILNKPIPLKNPRQISIAIISWHINSEGFPKLHLLESLFQNIKENS